MNTLINLSSLFMDRTYEIDNISIKIRDLLKNIIEGMGLLTMAAAVNTGKWDHEGPCAGQKKLGTRPLFSGLPQVS